MRLLIARYSAQNVISRVCSLIKLAVLKRFCVRAPQHTIMGLAGTQTCNVYIMGGMEYARYKGIPGLQPVQVQ